MKRYISLTFIIVCLCSCSSRYAHIVDDSFNYDLPPEELVKELGSLPVSTIIPDRVKTIRMAFHFFNNEEGSINYKEDKGPEVVSILLDVANQRMKSNDKMMLPVGNDIPVYDSKIRYKLARAEEGPAIFYHYDKSPPYFFKKSKNSNIYDRDVVTKYAYRPDSILNVLVLPFDPEFLQNGKEKAGLTGVALGTTIKLPGLFQSGKPVWDYAGTFNHEVGHVLGLRHAWNKYDQCNDTPIHDNCWTKTTHPPCNHPTSNNLMDYNAHQSAMTPCQIEKMHATLANQNHRARGLVIEDICLKQPGILEISEWTKWIQPFVIDKDVVIMKGGLLFLGEDVHLASDVSIKVEKGGTLVLKRTTIGGSCGPWVGIYKHPKGRIFDLSNAPLLKY